jgi:hypothetical protein
MMADINEEERYGLFGLVIGLQNKDLPLITENLLKVRTVAVCFVKVVLIIASSHTMSCSSAS